MSLVYKWEITSLKTADRPGYENVVVQTHWKVTGTDKNGNEGSFAGATPFDLDEDGDGNFTPFEQLKEEDVLSWIKVEADKYWDHIEGKILESIKVNSVKEVDLP